MGVRQGRHELEERRVVVMERSDVVGVDEGAGEVDAGDAVGGALEQARKLEPAPGAVAGTVHQDKVLLRGFGNIAARVISSAWCVVCGCVYILQNYVKLAL